PTRPPDARPAHSRCKPLVKTGTSDPLRQGRYRRVLETPPIPGDIMKLHSVLVLFALVGCSDKGDDSSGGGNGGGDDSTPPGNEDADNDGFDVTEDCNDGDATINPDAKEICDGVDNDCANGIDDGVTTPFYADTDADGYGAGKATDACEAPKGFVDNADDCD